MRALLSGFLPLSGGGRGAVVIENLGPTVVYTVCDDAFHFSPWVRSTSVALQNASHGDQQRENLEFEDAAREPAEEPARATLRRRGGSAALSSRKTERRMHPQLFCVHCFERKAHGAHLVGGR